MSQAELAERTGRPKKTINEIIKGKAALTPETALQLERVLGVPSSFWNKRDNHYREYQAMRQEEERLRHKVDWLDGLPIREMAKLGWLRLHSEKVRQLQEVLDFFGVASPEVWNRLWHGPKTSLRPSKVFRSDPVLLAGWLRAGELRARGIQCAPFDAERFAGALDTIRKLTLDPPQKNRRQLTRICAEAGVALVFLPEPPKSMIGGAARWLAPFKGLMQISLRFATEDQFWIMLFREAGHLLLDGKRAVFLDTIGHERFKATAADNFAARKLLGTMRLHRLRTQAGPTRESLKAFAEKIELSPGVLVGLLQQRGILAHGEFNELKRAFRLNAA